MRGPGVFFRCHPLVNFLYFGLVLGCAMSLMHPACLAVSLGCALVCRGSLGGGSAGLRALAGALPLVLLTALVNPAFNHEGVTILAYLPGGNPLTLESAAFGAAAGAMLAGVLVWCSFYGAGMTSDKFVYLFGRIIPALSLVLSMALRFIPRFRLRLAAAVEAGQGLRREERESRIAKVRAGASALSILVTWSLESAVETAESMKSRGYGLPGRTAFSLYRMDGRDRGLLLWLGCCGAYLLSGHVAGGLPWRYFPTLQGGGVAPFSLSLVLCQLALCLTPVILERWEEWKWTHFKFGI